MIEIAILCRDRKDYFIESLESAINQDYKDGPFKIKISDNSLGDEIEILYKERYATNKNIEYIRRIPESTENFRQVARESNAEFIVIFHDDDVLCNNYLSQMMPIIKNDMSISALACNSIHMSHSMARPFFIANLENKAIILDNPKEFLERYLPNSKGISSFPGYMYRTNCLVKTLKDKNDAGKHSDVTMLSDLFLGGHIVWTPEVLMLYRLHSSNDSNTNVIRDRVQLHRYMIKNGVEVQNRNFKLFRLLAWLKHYEVNKKKLIKIIKIRLNIFILNLDLVIKSFLNKCMKIIIGKKEFNKLVKR